MGISWKSLALLKDSLGNVGEGVTSYLKNRQEEEERQNNYGALKEYMGSEAGQGFDPKMANLAFQSNNFRAMPALQSMATMRKTTAPTPHFMTQPKTGAIDYTQVDSLSGTPGPVQNLVPGVDPAANVEWVQAQNPDGSLRFELNNGLKTPVLQAHDKSTREAIPGWIKFGTTVQERANANTVGGAADQMDDVALDFYARRVLSGFPEPSFGRDIASKRRFYKKVSDLATQSGISGEQSVQTASLYKAHTKAIVDLTARKALLKSYEGAALKNIGLAEQALAKYGGSAVPSINGFRNWINYHWNNDPDLTSAENAVYTAVREYAKVATGSLGAAGLTDAGMKEAERLLNMMQTPEQNKAAMAMMKRDLANVPAAIDEELNAERSLISQLMGSTQQFSSDQNTAPAVPATNAPPQGSTVRKWGTF